MREDLGKLVTEKERRGSASCSSNKYGGRVKVVYDPEHDYQDEYGGFHSSARHRHRDSKDLSDVLNPLYGNLRKNVGRKWDDIFSEFCKVLDRRSLSGIHVIDSHLFSRYGGVTRSGLYVSIDGNVRESKDGALIDGYYVHPWTGILCYREPRRYSKDWRKTSLLNGLYAGKVKIGDKNYELINNCWFEVWYEKRREYEFKPCWTQHESEKWYQDNSYKQYKGKWGHWYLSELKNFVENKRSIGRSEIRRVKKYIAEQIEKINNGAKIKDVAV